MNTEKSEAIGVRSRKPSLMAAVGVASLAMTGWLGGTAAQAQEADEVVVTGSRIVTPGFTAPTPVTSVSQADLEVREIKQANQLQYSIPQLVPNNSVQGTNPTGFSLMNLRGLGGLRTLLLLDGRRIAPTSYTGETDANIIPTSLIKRVDVVTGGASAAYGSDAVAGVVNFVLDTTFEGFKGGVSAGQSQYGDNEEFDINMTGGFSFDGGRGHVVVSAEIFENSGASGSINKNSGAAIRPYANKGWALIPGGAGFPSQISRPNVKFSSMTNGGLITSGPLKGIYFGENASLNSMTYGTNISATYMVGGTGDETQLMGSVSPELSRQSIFAHASYDLTPNVKLWGQVIGIHNYSWSPNVPNYDNNTLTIRNDNPYIPAALQTMMTAQGVTQFTFGRIDPELGLGASRGRVHDTLWNLGLTGTAFGDWNWDVTGQFNASEWDFKYENQRNNALWALGIDVIANPAVGGVAGVATGAPVCRSRIANPGNGCVPINLFGYDSITPGAVDYVHGTSHNYVPSETWDFSANLNGVLFENWAGPVSVATGYEVRRTSLRGEADPVSQARQWRGGNILPFSGHFLVSEGYVETDVPLLKDAPLAQELGLNMAARLINYDTFGNVTAWKVGLNDQMTDDLRARVVLSHDIRAPTLNDLYSASVSSSGQFFNNVTKQTQTLTTTTQGNPLLQPEESNTVTAGFVYSPSWFSGFTVAMDYYNIDLQDGIQTTTAQQLVDNCQVYGIQEACALMTVNAAGQVTAISVRPLNVANTKMDGVDTEFTYSFPGDAIWDKLNGNFRLRTVLTYVNKITSTNTAGVTTNAVMQSVNSGVGISGSIPRWVVVSSANYSTDKWNFLVDTRFTGALRFNNTYVEGVDIDNNHIPSRFYVNASVEHELREGWKVFGRVSNVFNVEPPVNPSNNLIVPTTSVSQAYDRIGRVYNVGLRWNF